VTNGSSIFVIEDGSHAVPQGEFDTLRAENYELRRRAIIPWDADPNLAPCAD